MVRLATDAQPYKHLEGLGGGGGRVGQEGTLLGDRDSFSVLKEAWIKANL